MKSVSKKITTNSRVIKELLTQYSDTFAAFRELINNSLQASAKNITINIEYINTASEKSPIRKIIIKDDGYGVPFSEFDNRILEIGTTVKVTGQGIGRFGALQIGELMHIETVAYEKKEAKYSKTTFGLDSLDLSHAVLQETEFKVDYEYLDGKVNPYYQVTIEKPYHNRLEKILTKNLISSQFLEDNIRQSIFERYPFEIFHKGIAFSINGKVIKRDEFVVGKPFTKKVEYKTTKGDDKNLYFHFYKVNLPIHKVKVFFQIQNAGILSVAHEFTFSSDWFTQDLGTWFIYVDSKYFSSDLFRKLDVESLGEEEIKNLKSSVKDTINEFFKERNKKFEKFVTNLTNDKYYPFSNENAASKTQELIFTKIAYLLEDEHKLLEKNNKIRTFIYPLINKALENGNIEFIFREVLKLSPTSLEKFQVLLGKTDLEDVVHFASLVSEKLEFLDFLHELNYGDISKYIKERSQLHKIVEDQLWLFGESYNGSPNLWSDKKIGNILKEIRTKYFSYEPTTEDGNLIDLQAKSGLNDITDLFFLNEKITDNDAREILIVELKSPKCAISEKEIAQINKYAFTLEQNSALPTDKVNYKLILIGSKLTKYAKSQVRSRRKTFPDHPFLFDRKTEKNIEIYIMEWSELMEQNKRKLGYLSTKLKVKDKSVKMKFEKEYSDLIDAKLKTQLRLVM